MKKHTLLALLVIAVLGVLVQPVLGVNKEELQMMQQLDALQQAVQNLQKTVDTQTAVLKTLIEQANDNVNSMKATVTDLHGSLQQNVASSGARFDTMTSQMQALSESLDEAKARLSKLSEQMAQMQTILTTLPASNPGGGTWGRSGSSSHSWRSCQCPTRIRCYTQGMTLLHRRPI